MAADFTEHRLLRDWPSDSAARTDAVTAAIQRGATWLSARFGDRHLVVEGSHARPKGPRAGAAVKIRP